MPKDFKNYYSLWIKEITQRNHTSKSSDRIANISGIFDNFFENLIEFNCKSPCKIPISVLYDMMETLWEHKAAYDNNKDTKIEFLTNCKQTIAATAQLFESDVSLFKTIANTFFKLVNAVLPSHRQFGFFEPEKTQAQQFFEAHNPVKLLDTNNELDRYTDELLLEM